MDLGEVELNPDLIPSAHHRLHLHHSDRAMSLSAKAFFGASCLIAVASIGGVHYSQLKEREASLPPSHPFPPTTPSANPPRAPPPPAAHPQTMYAGVLRDEARRKLKTEQRAREAEFEEQTRKRAFLEGVVGQQVSRPVQAAPTVVGQVPASAEGLDFGCKTGMCEKP